MSNKACCNERHIIKRADEGAGDREPHLTAVNPNHGPHKGFLLYEWAIKSEMQWSQIRYEPLPDNRYLCSGLFLKIMCRYWREVGHGNTRNDAQFMSVLNCVIVGPDVAKWTSRAKDTKVPLNICDVVSNREAKAWGAVVCSPPKSVSMLGLPGFWVKAQNKLKVKWV